MLTRMTRFDVILFVLFIGLTVALFFRLGPPLMLYRTLEFVPVWAYFFLFGLGLPLLRGRLRLSFLWIAALVIPWVYSTVVIVLLFYYYGNLGYHPYQSWDISLTYLRIGYMFILYPYSIILAIRESLVFDRPIA